LGFALKDVYFMQVDSNGPWSILNHNPLFVAEFILGTKLYLPDLCLEWMTMLSFLSFFLKFIKKTSSHVSFDENPGIKHRGKEELDQLFELQDSTMTLLDGGLRREVMCRL
jgi:hypothetical protein